MNVLSLFDGISCGMVALERAGIKVDNYYASEICDYSIKISEKNYPKIKHIGDVRDINYKGGQKIDILIGGSPCQSFSFAGKKNGMSTKDNVEVTTLEQYLELKEQGFEFDGYSYLFWEYVRLLKETKPKYFLLENVKMAKKWEKIITDALEVEPIIIDSALVSAQHRERLYWTNIPNITQPENKNIKVQDILEDIFIEENVETFKKCVRMNVIEQYNTILNSEKNIQQLVCTSGWQDNKVGIFKSPTLRHTSSFCLVRDKQNKVRRITVLEAERLQTLPDEYTSGVKDTSRFNAIGNGWTVDVIAHIFSFLPEKYKERKEN